MKVNKEIAVGVLLTALLAGILTVVHNRSVHHHSSDSFILKATFTKADGLMLNGEVRLAGIQVGQIGKQYLADNGYQVTVEFVFDHPMDIPTDSSVSIETDGIMGAKHIEILPGGDEEMMQSGDTFSYTQDSLILNELLDKVNAFMKDKKDKEAILKDNQPQEVL